MSRLRIMVAGKPEWAPNEPDGRARLPGFGGHAIGAAVSAAQMEYSRRRREQDAARAVAKRTYRGRP